MRAPKNGFPAPKSGRQKPSEPSFQARRHPACPGAAPSGPLTFLLLAAQYIQQVPSTGRSDLMEALKSKGFIS